MTEARGPIGSTLAAAHPTKSRSRCSTAPDLASASTVRTRIGAQCVARTPIPTLTANVKPDGPMPIPDVAKYLKQYFVGLVVYSEPQYVGPVLVARVNVGFNPCRPVQRVLLVRATQRSHLSLIHISEPTRQAEI